MTNSTIEGKNFLLHGGTMVDIFGCKGLKGKRCAINAFGGELMVEVEVISSIPDILNCIDQDVKAGNGGKIAILVVSPQYAVSLFLQEILMPQLFQKATEHDDVIDIPEVHICGLTLTVRIDPYAVHSCATADAEGHIL